MCQGRRQTLREGNNVIGRKSSAIQAAHSWSLPRCPSVGAGKPAARKAAVRTQRARSTEQSWWRQGAREIRQRARWPLHHSCPRLRAAPKGAGRESNGGNRHLESLAPGSPALQEAPHPQLGAEASLALSVGPVQASPSTSLTTSAVVTVLLNQDRGLALAWLLGVSCCSLGQ